jgi:hypothetical protein
LIGVPSLAREAPKAWARRIARVEEREETLVAEYPYKRLRRDSHRSFKPAAELPLGDGEGRCQRADVARLIEEARNPLEHKWIGRCELASSPPHLMLEKLDRSVWRGDGREALAQSAGRPSP